MADERNADDTGDEKSEESDGRPNRRRILQGTAALTAGSLVGYPGMEAIGDTADASEETQDCQSLSDNITEDTTLDGGEDGCYRVEGNVTVKNGATLTIEPGTEFRVAESKVFRIGGEGTIKAIGEPDDKIVFEGAEATSGHWHGVVVDSDNDNELRHTVVRHGGQNQDHPGRYEWTNAYVGGGAKAAITNCVFEQSSNWGLWVKENAELPEFANNEFRDNEAPGVRMPANALRFLEGSSTFAGDNQGDWIEVRTPHGDGVTEDATWPNTDAPYRFVGNPQLNATVTVAAGARLTFEGSKAFRVHEEGAIKALGEQGNQVVFEGTEATAGHWHGLIIDSPKENELRHTVVRHGGENQDHPGRSGTWANAYVGRGSTVSITNSTFAQSRVQGLRIRKNVDVKAFSENHFRDNQGSAIKIAGNLLGVLDAASTYVDGNVHDRIEVNNKHEVAAKDPATWSNVGAPYYFDDDPQIRAEVTVEPGTRLTFPESKAFRVREGGAFKAMGAPRNKVLLEGTEAKRGHWHGLIIESGNDNVLRHTVVRHGGENQDHPGRSGTWANAYVGQGSKVSITNSTFERSRVQGLRIRKNVDLPQFSENQFRNNGGAALKIAGNMVRHLDERTSYAGDNENDWIEINNKHGVETLEDADWPDVGVPYYLDQGLHVKSEVTVGPGAVLKFGQSKALHVHSEGTLRALGEQGDEIVIEGSEATPGHWHGIIVHSENENWLHHAIVRHGGEEHNHPGRDRWTNTSVRGGARLSVTNTVFEQSSRWGLWVREDAELPRFSDNAFLDNGRSGIRIPADLIGALDTGTTYGGGNENEWIDVYRPHNDPVEVDATWSATDAPYFFRNSTLIRSNVDVEPGAEFVFDENVSLAVHPEGTFTARGEPGRQIVFDGAEETPGYWDGIEIASDNRNVIDHVVVRNAGGKTNIRGRIKGGLYLEPGSLVTLTNSTFERCEYYGVRARGRVWFHEFANNVFRDNGREGLRIPTMAIGALDEGSTYGGGNGHDRVKVYGHAIMGDLRLSPLDVPYYFTDNVTLDERATIEGGADLRFDKGRTMSVEGPTFFVEGTEAAPVTFDKAADTDGHWDGIEIGGDSQASLDHCTVARGGQDRANIYVGDGADTILENVAVIDSATNGIYAEQEGDLLEVGGNTYSGNSQCDIHYDETGRCVER